MRKLKIDIGTLVETISEFKKIKLNDCEEISVGNLGCRVQTPSGMQNINYVIKKYDLCGINFTFTDNTELHCADQHILFTNGKEIYANSLHEGSAVDTVHGQKFVHSISYTTHTNFYDLSLAYPHLYNDYNGIIHHNTLITATLSRCVEKYGRSLVIVPNKTLVGQTEADYINLGLDVGVYFGDRKDYNKTHTICTWQSLNNLFKAHKDGDADPKTMASFFDGVACVMVDECHGVKADALKTMLSGVLANVPLRWGLTGTIPKSDFDRVTLLVSLGPVINKLAASELQGRGVLASCHVNILQLQDKVAFTNYQSELKHLLENEKRLDRISNIISKISASGNTLILVDRVNAGTELVKRIDGAVFVSGKTKEKDRKEEYDEVATSDHKVLVCTYGVAAVGINIPRIFNLVLIEPGKSFVRVIQSIGRGIRKASDKDDVQIWDITSSCKFAKRHLTQRKIFYKEAQYPFTIEKVDI
jgi:hypothetical protein